MSKQTTLSPVFLFPLLLLLFILTAAPVPVQAQDQPTIAKDSVRVWSIHPKYLDVKGWAPVIAFRVNGPIAKGSTLWVEFGLPTNRQYLKYDCPQIMGDTKKGDAWVAECGSDEYLIPKNKVITFTGMIDFTIHVRNELLETNATLFTGKAKVIKVLPKPNSLDDIEYYVDEDWRIPIGYVYLERVGNGEPSMVDTTFWIRGGGRANAHLFYQGNDLEEVNCGASSSRPAGTGVDMWHEWECKFDDVYDTRVPSGRSFNPEGIHLLSKNPGEYEIKVLVDNHLARSIKFTVGPDGSFDNGIAAANQLNDDSKVIVPVRVIGDQPQWDKLAWKTEAFYGNPLTGFTPSQ